MNKSLKGRNVKKISQIDRKDENQKKIFCENRKAHLRIWKSGFKRTSDSNIQTIQNLKNHVKYNAMKLSVYD